MNTTNKQIDEVMTLWQNNPKAGIERNDCIKSLRVRLQKAIPVATPAKTFQRLENMLQILCHLWQTLPINDSMQEQGSQK